MHKNERLSFVGEKSISSLMNKIIKRPYNYILSLFIKIIILITKIENDKLAITRSSGITRD